MEATQRLTRKEKIAQGVEKLAGNRKKRSAEARKEANKTIAFASLKKYPSSPRKMRLLADLVRGQEIGHALNLLYLSPKAAAKPLEKLLRSALNNYTQKFPDVDLDSTTLIVKEIFVDPGVTLKRIRPAPQGRAYRVRKRSNHVTVIIDNKTTGESTQVNVTANEA
jgi:large subunit ribosomal protein L22